MKKSIYLFVIMVACLGCESKYNTFSESHSVYFEKEMDTTAVSFTYIDASQKEYRGVIDVNIIGNAVDYDRKVSVKITTKSCKESVDFESLSDTYVLAANQHNLTIPYTLLRTDDLRNGVKYIEMELLENADFNVDYKFEKNKNTNNKIVNKTLYIIAFSELMSEPPITWNNYYFGNFSYSKFVRMCDVMGLPRSKFIDRKYMTFGRISYIASSMKNYFIEKKKAGEIVFEDDGKTEMSMGAKI